MSPTAYALLGDVTHGLRVAGSLLGLGLIMGFSPTTYGIEVGTIEHAHQARLRVLVIAGAVALAATLLAALFLVVSPNTIEALWTGEVRTIIEQRWFDLAVGILIWATVEILRAT